MIGPTKAKPGFQHAAWLSTCRHLIILGALFEGTSLRTVPKTA